MRRRSFLRGIGAAGVALGWQGTSRGASRDTTAGRRGSAPARSLADAGATLGLTVTRFDGSHVADTASVPFPLSTGEGSAKLTLQDTLIKCRTRAVAARDRRDASDIEVQFRVMRGRLPNARLAVTLTLAPWSRDAYVVVPGAVYGGNRFASRHIPFPPLPAEPSDIGPHVPPIVSDIPRLNNQAGESRIVLTATDAAVPCIGVRMGEVMGNGSEARGFVVLADPSTTLGLVDLAVEENADRSAATLSVGTPAVRPDVRYELGNNRVPSHDRGADLEAGGTVILRLRVLAFACRDIQTMFDRWYEARRDRLGPVKLRHNVPLSVGRRAIEERLLVDQWSDASGIFITSAPTIVGAATAATAPVPRLESIFRTGADGGLALALPMMASGAADARRRAAAVLDFQLSGQSPSGFFHAASNGTTWWDEGESPPAAAEALARANAVRGLTNAAGRKAGEGSGADGKGKGAGAGRVPEARPPRGRHWTHVGRHAEALHLACKQVLFLKTVEPGYRPSARWRTALGRAADALARLWTRHKQLGQYVNCDTGEIAVGGSAAGALGPAALILAGRVLETDSYDAQAAAAAEGFYARFVRAGLTLGDAPAALQSPDSRSAAALLESFVTLAEATGDAAWFDRAAEMAHQVATWVIGWNMPLPQTSTLGKMEVETTGAVLVSAQDKWALPGFAGLSGDVLFRLYRATGRVSYLELLRETVHNSSGYVDLEDRRPDLDSKAGWVAGRIPVGDALGPVGEVPPGTPAGTAQASCLLAATEVPSIYVQPDTGFVFAFDHVEARLVGKTGETTTIKVHNPTRFEAELRLFSENDGERARILRPFPMWGARTLTLAPGAAENVEFSRTAIP